MTTIPANELLREADRLVGLGRRPAAFRLLRRGAARARRQQDERAAQRLEIELLFLDERPHQALRAADRALARYPGDRGLLVARAESLLTLGFVGLAERSLRHAGVLGPSGICCLAHTLLASGQVDAGLRLLEAAREEHPRNPLFAAALALALRRAERPWQALEQAFSRLHLAPPDYRCARLYGLLLAEVGEFRAACDAYQGGLSLEPEDPVGRRLLGVALRARGMLTEALAAFDQALVLAADDPTTLIERARTLIRLDRPEAARKHLDRALSREDAPLEGFLVRARFLFDHGRWEQCQADVRLLLSVQAHLPPAFRAQVEFLAAILPIARTT